MILIWKLQLLAAAQYDYRDARVPWQNKHIVRGKDRSRRDKISSFPKRVHAPERARVGTSN